MLPRLDNYTTTELDTLVTEYEELGYLRGRKAFVHVRLIDLDRVFKLLPPAEAEAIFLIGVCGHTQRESAKIAGVSQSTMSRRFIRGLDYLARYLNGV